MYGTGEYAVEVLRMLMKADGIHRGMSCVRKNGVGKKRMGVEDI